MLVIKQLRKKNNESQTDLSLILSVSLRTVQNYESGNVTVPSEKLKLIAQYYGVTVSYLFKDENEIKEIPTLKKSGIELNIKEILVFIIENEVLLKQDKQFLRYLNEIGREAIIKYLTENNMIKK